MDFDDLAISANQKLTTEWASLFDLSLAGITELASKYRGNSRCQLVSKHCGSFNFCVRLRWDDDGGPDWLIRFPISGKSIFPEEKLHAEAATMRFMRANTTIPVPEVIAYGTAADNPTGLGPFLIMTWVEGIRVKELMVKKNTEDGEDICTENWPKFCSFSVWISTASGRCTGMKPQEHGQSAVGL